MKILAALLVLGLIGTALFVMPLGANDWDGPDACVDENIADDLPGSTSVSGSSAGQRGPFSKVMMRRIESTVVEKQHDIIRLRKTS